MDEHKPLLEYDTSTASEVSQNPYQGDYKKVLCVCSAGILRSATAAVVLSKSPFHFNTRSAGVEYYALIPVTLVLIRWADEIVCMTREHVRAVSKLTSKPIKCLNIQDAFEYRNKDLQRMIKEGYPKADCF